MVDPLTAAIDGLYETFAIHRRPATFLGCGCCFDGRLVPGRSWDDLRPLAEVDAPGGGRPLREVAPSELADLAWNVPRTGGTVELLQHYLPRILEIVAGERFEWPDAEVVLAQLGSATDRGGAAWSTWPPPERDAVQAFLDAWWERDRRVDPSSTAAGDLWEAGDTLCAIAQAAPDVTAYLTAWSEDRDPAAIASLRRFRADNGSGAAADLTNPFWSTNEEPGRANRVRVLTWLGAPGPVR